MSEEEKKQEEENQIKIYHRVNRLKLKAGADPEDPRPGFIDVNAVRNAQKVIDNSAVEYKKEVRNALDDLEGSWDVIKGKKGGELTKKEVNALYNQAHNIKDIAETYKYDLMEYFSHSLRDFSKKIDPDNPKHKIIVQAHMDVMAVAYKNNMKEQTTPAAEELKKVLAKAIEKYS